MADFPTSTGLDPLAAATLAGFDSAGEKVKSLSGRELSNGKEGEKAAAGFEALLLHQMLKSMWETVETTGLMGENSNEAQIYRDMLNQAISDSISEGPGIGVKKMLLQQLNKVEKAS